MRTFAAAVGFGVTDIPILTAPDLQSGIGIAIFAVNLVVFTFLLAVTVLAARMYYLRVSRQTVPETEPVWLRTFDNHNAPDGDAYG